jgi:glycosyltransferase involved in cell wall biosynthesis
VGLSRAALNDSDGLATIVRVDRLDPAKNILGGFEAFRLLLERHPEWRGRVRFLAFLVPSREAIPEYRRYKDEVFALIEEINARYGNGRWRPITVFYEENRPQALAGLSLYDVLLTNSLADGMNLVAKEGPVLNQRDGVVVLSTGVGAYQELQGAALGVEAEDIDGTTEALHRALRMAPEERELARTLRVVYDGALLNGPFSIIVGFEGGMFGLTDRIKLRPMVAAQAGEIFYLASEESAIRTVAPELDQCGPLEAGKPALATLKEGAKWH